MFPKIELEPDDNVDDINRFVKETAQSAIERKQLLDGNVPNERKYAKFSARSKGM